MDGGYSRQFVMAFYAAALAVDADDYDDAGRMDGGIDHVNAVSERVFVHTDKNNDKFLINFKGNSYDKPFKLSNIISCVFDRNLFSTE